MFLFCTRCIIVLFIPPIFRECTPNKAHTGHRTNLNTNFAFRKCRKEVLSAHLWPDKNLLTYVNPEDRYRRKLGDSYKIASFWIIFVSKLKSLATNHHFETECHFLVTNLLFACRRTHSITSFPLLPFPWTLLVLDQLPHAPLPLSWPSCDIIDVIFRFANSAAEG